MTPQEFWDKCEHEGGGLFEGFEYGLRRGDLDESNPYFNDLILLYQNAYDDFKCREEEIMDEIDKYIERN